MKKLLRFFIRIVAVLFITASTSAAALLVYEGFDYDVGEDLTGKSDGIGFGSNAWTSGTGITTSETEIASGSLPSGSLVTTGNSAGSDKSGKNADLRNFAGSYDSGVIWTSFLVKPVDFRTADFENIRFGMAGSLGNPLVTTVASGSDNRWALRAFGLNVTLATAADPITLNQTYLMVTKLTFNSNVSNDNVDFWIDPDLNSEPSTTSASYIGSNDTQNFGSITGLNFYAASNGKADFDEIRLGDSFGDVAAAIPEPSTVVLVLLGGLAALLLLHRRAA
jgi:hypothetical protein